MHLSRFLAFDVPATWRQPTCHEIGCYFCLTKVNLNGRHRFVKYAEAESFSKPILRTSASPYPICPKRKDQSDDTDNADMDYNYAETDHIIKPLTEAELNDWIRDLELSKDKSELLASRMKERNFVSPKVKITNNRKRHERFGKYFAQEGSITYCKDSAGLFQEFGVIYDPNDWRLFIDSSKLSLKAVLLHKGNKLHSIPLAHAVNMKESYESMSKLLALVKYEEHQWKICADLKVVAMVTGLQQGWTKHCCFLCRWDSRDRSEHYVRKDWDKRANFLVGEDNVKFPPLVQKDKIILPPLHIKLGLFKNFVKALHKNKNFAAFEYLKRRFPQLSDAKIKEGVFVGPQIKKLLNDTEFYSALSADEAKAWQSFCAVVSSFLGNKRSEDYKVIVNDLLENYKKIGIISVFFSRVYIFTNIGFSFFFLKV